MAPALGMATCEKCEPGKFTASMGSFSCKNCPMGKTSVAGSISETDCNLDSDSTVTLTLTETVRLMVYLPMTQPEFDDEKQQNFKEAIAKTAGQSVRADHVIIDTIEEMSTAARRLLAQGIRIAVSVNVVDKTAADAIMVRLTEQGINEELEKAGLPPVTLLEPAALVKTTNSAIVNTTNNAGRPGSEAEEAGGGVPVAGIVGGAAALLLALAGPTLVCVCPCARVRAYVRFVGQSIRPTTPSMRPHLTLVRDRGGHIDKYAQALAQTQTHKEFDDKVRVCAAALRPR